MRTVDSGWRMHGMLDLLRLSGREKSDEDDEIQGKRVMSSRPIRDSFPKSE